MFKSWNKQWIGYLLGALLPIITLVVEFFTIYRGTKFFAFFEIAWLRGNLPAILSLALIPNMLLFFIFIWLNRLKSAQGVLGATIMLAILVIIIKFVG